VVALAWIPLVALLQRGATLTVFARKR